MKVLIPYKINSSKGGSYLKLVDSINAMLNKNWEVHYISNKKLKIQNKNLYPHIITCNNKEICNNISFLIKLYKQSKELFSNNNFNLIYSIHPFFILTEYLALKNISNKPSICSSVRGNFELEQKIKKGAVVSKLFSIIEKISLDKSDFILVVNNDLKRKFIKKFNIRKKIFVIPNSINHKIKKSEKNREKFRRKYNLKNSNWTIGFLGDFGKIKGLEYLINAYAGLRSKMPSSRLLIAGTFKNRTHKILSKENKNIIFLGQINKINEFLNGIDIFVMPSLYEGSPNALLEAISCDKIAIGSNIGGIKETLKYNDLLFKPKSSNSIKKKILNIYTNKDKQSLSRKILERKKKFDFDWDKTFIEIIKQNVKLQ